MTRRKRVSPDDVTRIWVISTRSVEAARIAYKDTFGVSVEDRSIRQEFAELTWDAMHEDVVQVPIGVAVGLVLRKSSTVKEPGDKNIPTRTRRAIAIEVRLARRRKQRLKGRTVGCKAKAKGRNAKQAEETAAKLAWKRLRRRGYYPVPSVSRIMDLISGKGKMPRGPGRGTGPRG